MPQMIAYAPRDTNLTTLDQSLEPGGDVHAIAKKVTVLDHDIADIDADPEAHPASFRFICVCLLKSRLDLDRTTHCIENASEFGEYAIARRIRDPTSMTGDEFVDEAPPGGQRRHRRFFVAVHQAAVALDISGEDGHQAPLERRRLHLETPLPFHKMTEGGQRAGAVAYDLSDRQHWRRQDRPRHPPHPVPEHQCKDHQHRIYRE